MAPLKNLKHEAFCLEYARTANGTQSYWNAGYTTKNEKAASASARRLLQKDSIQRRLKELSAEMASEKIASIAEIQERLTAILRGDLQEEQVVVEGCGDGVSEAKIIRRQPQLKDIIKAGETLGRMQGAFDNKLQVEMTIPVFGGDDNLED